MSAYDETGVITVWSDFTGFVNDHVWGTGTLVGDLANGIGFTSDDEGSFANTVDEPGGILAITTDVGDDDNAFLFAGPFFARDGGCEMKARFKFSSATCAILVGFQETLSATTPVMGAEFATATMTYGNIGNVVGFNYDSDGTTDDFRALMGDGQAALSDSGNGVRANATITADRWYEVEVYVGPTGIAECWLSDPGHVDADSIPQLRLIKRFSTGTLTTTTDPIFAVLGIENRDANARVLEVDYFGAKGYRDRRPT